MTADPADIFGEVAALTSQINALCAARASALLAAGRAQVDRLISGGVTDPEELERVVKDRAGQALRVSPTRAGERVRAARDLHLGLDHVRDLFSAGLLDEYTVGVITDVTRHLSAAERAKVDHRLADRNLETLSVGRIRNLTKKVAVEIAPNAFAARVTAARAGRWVIVRPSREDGMAVLSAHLPLEQAAACLGALDKAVKQQWVRPEPVTRTRPQMMADTMVERITGQSCAENVNAEIQVLVPIEALLDPDSPMPAELPGLGPLPAHLLATWAGRATLRRLFTSDGVIIGGESRSRGYRGSLAKVMHARDGGRCTAPYCEAPIRHHDHRIRHSHGGPHQFRQRPRVVRVPQSRPRSRNHSPTVRERTLECARMTRANAGTRRRFHRETAG
jgi:hypothetical protein